MSNENVKDFPLHYEEIRTQIIEHLENSNINEAYFLIKEILNYPGQIENNLMWKDVFILFKRIAKESAEDDLALLMEDVIENPDNIGVLYSLAYELYEQNLNGIAATLLKRANEIKPQVPKIVSELASNLEVLMLHHEAHEILSSSKELIDSDEMCRYLLGFNGLMTGNIEEPLKILPTLSNSEDSEIQFMYRALKGMVNRAFVLKKNRSLDHKDLRGWHMALNGSILLHLSPFGFEDAMFGRYAYVSDTYSLIKEGIYRVKEILDVSGISIPAVLSLPNQSSQILSIAASKLLNTPLKKWEDVEIETPGLIVAYDLDENLSGDLLIEIADHRPGQILWAHASCWTNPYPLSPDITTFLYQTNVNPWGGGRMAYNMEEKQVKIIEPDKSSDEDIAQLIIEATIDEEYFDDVDDLTSMIGPLKTLEYDDQPGIFKRAGRRMRQRLGSPVRSNRFT